MADNCKSYRIRTNVGQDTPNVINVKLDQTYDEFQILSLKIEEENAYKLYQSEKGVVVGRVLANGGVGVSNAKVSVFIKSEDGMDIKDMILYPYKSVTDTNDDSVRYNLLPDFIDETCHQIVGTFPNKRLVLDNEDVIEIFDKYWKYTTVTNSSGDYMLYGIPVGEQTMHMDVDLSDIGFLSQKPRDLVYKGYNINLFENPNKFKQDTNLNSLAQIKSQDKSVYVYPFWGDTSTDNSNDIAVTRCDFQIDYKFEPTCIFMGSIITDTGSNAIGKNCSSTDNAGKMSDLVSGEGSIEMIRKTIDNKVEEFQVKGNRVIDGDGVWCYQIPMNLDYVMTDEFGNLVPTDNPDKGIPTRTRVRFRISLSDNPADSAARKRCKYLVPNNPRFDEKLYPEFTADKMHEPDYEFGTNTREESYCDLFWNKVYTVKNYIPRLQKNNRITNRKHTGIKLINHYGSNNPMPYNNLSVKLSFLYRFICVLVTIFIMLVGFLNNIISILGAIPCQIARFFRAIASIFIWPIKFLGYPFKAAAAVFDLLTPPCIAISSEFCSEDVTHPYTFYPGCGMKGLAYVLGPLAECVWDKTRDNHFEDMESVPQEDRTYPTNNEGELYNCVESQLANDNDVTSFNFHNDWINGTLYAPMWFRKVEAKKTYFFGLVKRKSKDEWCSVDHPYNGLLRLFQPCSVKRNASKSYTSHEGNTQTAYYMGSNPECDRDCHDTKTTVGLNNGLIKSKDSMLGQTIYYYRPFEIEKGNNNLMTDGVDGTLKLLFATDIVLLGSLNDCDLNGVPQFFKHLESSTFKLPTNMLFADNNMIQKFNEDGTLSTEYDLVSKSEMTGNDWGNSNADMCGEPDTGLFYSVGCSTIEMRPKSCINLQRICEFGVSLDESKEIPTNIAYVESGGDSVFETLRPDGYISKDELYNIDERSMFATMNGNELQTKVNIENGLKEYDFRHLYVDNFDNSLYDSMRMRQKRCGDYSYRNNFNLEEFSPGYYDFRMGKKPFYYDGARKFPRYENSFYFYFGLTVGKTAIDKFNNLFFAECYNPQEAVSPIAIETLGNTWCSEADITDIYNEKNDGYVKIDLSNIERPCDIIIQDKNSKFQINFDNVINEKIILSNKDSEGWTRKCIQSKDEHDILRSMCALDNGNYTMTVTDSSGEITVADFDLMSPYLKFEYISTPFKFPYNVLVTRYEGELTEEQYLKKIAEDKDGVDSTEKTLNTRTIGGTITLENVVDSLENTALESYNINITSSSKIPHWFNGLNSSTGSSETEETGENFILDIEVRYDSETKTWAVDNPSDYWLNAENYTESGGRRISGTQFKFIIGVPKGEERYKVTVTQYCPVENGQGTVEFYKTNNTYTETVFVSDVVPYKLYINDIIDYEVISHWGSGYKLENIKDKTGTVTKIKLVSNNTPSSFDRNSFSDNWLNISDFDGKNGDTYRYKWDKLVSYQKALKSLNNGLKEGLYSGIYDDFTYKIKTLGEIQQINPRVTDAIYNMFAKEVLPDTYEGFEEAVPDADTLYKEYYNAGTYQIKTLPQIQQINSSVTQEIYNTFPATVSAEEYNSLDNIPDANVIYKAYYNESHVDKYYEYKVIETYSIFHEAVYDEAGNEIEPAYYETKVVNEDGFTCKGFPLRDVEGFKRYIYRMDEMADTLLKTKRLSDGNTCVFIEGILTNDILNDHISFISETDSNRDSIIDFLYKIKNALANDENIEARDIADTCDTVIEACERILEIKAEFISEMKNAFWKTCPDEEKRVKFKAVTEDMPVAFYIAHRSEKSVEEGSGNTLEYGDARTLTYSFNLERDIDNITIPSISYTSSKNYGAYRDREDSYMVDTVNYPNVCLALDNSSPFRDKQKYAFFVGVINSSEQRVNKLNKEEPIPFGDTVPVGIKNNAANSNTSRLFGFHVIDKVMELKLISWAAFNGIPYYNPRNTVNDKYVTDIDKVGRTVDMCGLLSGKIYNGVISSIVYGENSRNIGSTFFESQNVGRFDMEIATPMTYKSRTSSSAELVDINNTEDSLPTYRFISGSTNADKSYYSWDNYYTDENNVFSDTKSAGGKTRQYIPLLPATVSLNITDTSFCNMTKEIYGGMSVVLRDNSVNNCDHKDKSILSVTISGGPTEGVVYFGYHAYSSNEDGKYLDINLICRQKAGVDTLNYPLNFVPIKGFDEEGKENAFNVLDIGELRNKYDEGTFMNCNLDGWRLFDTNINIWNMLFATTSYIKSTCRNDNNEEITRCEYFGLDCTLGSGDERIRNMIEDQLHELAIGTTGYFNKWENEWSGEYYIVAMTKDGSYAVSPVYSFNNVVTTAECGILRTKEYVTETVKDTVTGIETNISYWKEILTRTAVVFVLNTVYDNGNPDFNSTDNCRPLYYLDYFDYEMEVTCKLDSGTINQSGTVSPQKRVVHKGSEPDSDREIQTMKVFNGIWFELNDTEYGAFTREAKGEDLDDILKVKVRDVTGLLHETHVWGGGTLSEGAVIPIVTTNVGHEWYNVTCSLEGGYWPNYKDTTDNSDTEARSVNVEPIPRQGKTAFTLFELFGDEPKRDPVKANNRTTIYRFEGWKEVENEDAIVNHRRDAVNIDRAKIFKAVWSEQIQD